MKIFKQIVLQRVLKTKSGFTLIEGVLSMGVIAGALFGIMTMFRNLTFHSVHADMYIQASFLAREKMEEILVYRGTHTYALTLANYAAGSAAHGTYPDFTVTWSMTEVSSADLSTAAAGSGYGKISVGVSWGGSDSVTLYSLVTDYT